MFFSEQRQGVVNLFVFEFLLIVVCVMFFEVKQQLTVGL